MSTTPTTPDPNLGTGPDLDNGGHFEFIDSTDRNLPVALDTDTLAERGQELAQLGVDIEAAKEARKAEAKAAQDEINGMEERRRQLQKLVARGSEDRPVKCHRVGNWDANLIRYIRVDTGEVVEERAMEADERQASMFPNEPDGAQGAQVDDGELPPEAGETEADDDEDGGDNE